VSTYQKGDHVLVKGEVVEQIEGVGVCVEVFSKTDQYHAWVREDLVTSGVVLDFTPWTPGTAEAIADWITGHASDRDCPSGSATLMVAQEIEAQTKPPRIPEPGLWGVVEAKAPVDDRRIEWVHGRATDAGNDWHSMDGMWSRVWADLVDPVLVREGVES
jgi:hypothetical protein